MTLLRRIGLGSLLLLALALAACSRQTAFSDEMRQQERDMLNESSEWANQLAQWETEDGEMRTWYASHPALARSGAVDTSDLRRHEQKMVEHEEQLETFRKDLEAHRAKLQEETARPEPERVGAHAALWAEHLRLKAAYPLLNNAHRDLASEHAEIMAHVESPHR